LALVLAASPAISFLCEMDCDHPPAASEPCHAAHGSQHETALHSGPHPCNHDHAGGTPALLTGAKDRDFAGASVLIAFPPAQQALMREPHASRDAVMHGPPGPIVGSTSSRLIVLRI
jgi:hypothetical protein